MDAILRSQFLFCPISLPFSDSCIILPLCYHYHFCILSFFVFFSFLCKSVDLYRKFVKEGWNLGFDPFSRKLSVKSLWTCCVPELIQNIWVEPLRSLSTSKAERILGFKIGHAHGTCCPCPSHGKLKGWIPLCVNGNLSIKKTWVTLRYSNLWFGTKPMFICCTLQFTLMLGVHLDDGCCS